MSVFFFLDFQEKLYYGSQRVNDRLEFEKNKWVKGSNIQGIKPDGGGSLVNKTISEEMF